MKTNALFCLAATLCVSARGQTTFPSSDLPHQVGQYLQAYYSTNSTGLSALLTAPGGPQRWDISRSQTATETVLRTDIITPANGADGSSFPQATYAEQDTMEPNSQISWSYYNLTGTGRTYYGFYNPLDQNADYLVVFDEPTVDIPLTVHYGQTWNRSVTWSGLVLGLFPIDYQFHASATVDAYGTLVLPSLGAVPALRVHEVHGYEADEPNGDGTSTPVDIHTNQFYYWLVPKIGVAVQVFEFGDNVLFPAGLPYTNSLVRTFQASYYTNAPILGSVSGLTIRATSGSARLNWLGFTNAAGYRVEYIGTPANPAWQFLGQSGSNSWSDPLTATQRFYRVFATP